jgi:Na+-transporting methylmalonyl-CoA/oxaloacetate decarboxylase gamma subunit
MKKMILLVVLLTLVAFVSGVMAATPAPAPKPAASPAPAPKPVAPEKTKLEKFSGAIEKTDEMVKAIDVKGKVKKEEKTLTFATDDKTKITRGKDTLSFADLKKGMSASVEYQKVGDKMTAVAIKVAVPKAAPKKEAPKEAPKK